MQGSDVIFFIQDANFNFWGVDPNGNVVKTSNPYVLKYAPVGWDEVDLQNIRNKKYWGLDRSVINSLSYVEDGAAILKYIFYNIGFNEDCFLVAARLNLDFELQPIGAINVLTGNNPFVTGINTGTITGDPGSTVYFKVTGNPSLFTAGSVGTVGVNLISILRAGNSVYSIVMPSSGSVPYTITTAGGSSLVITNNNGNIQGSYGYRYKFCFRLQIDISTLTHIGPKITVSNLEDGFIKYLKANENTLYQFFYDDPNAIMVRIDGVNLHEKSDYSILSDFEITMVDFGSDFRTPASFLRNEGDSVGVSQFSQEIMDTSGYTWDQKVKLVNNLLTNFGVNYDISSIAPPLELTIVGTIEFTCTTMVSSPAYACKVRFLTSDQPVDVPHQDRYLLINTPSMVVGQTYKQDFNITVPLNINASLLLETFFYGGTGSNVGIKFTNNSNFSINYVTRQPPSYHSAFTPQYLFELLLDKVGMGNFVAAKSKFFDTYRGYVFTSGNALRTTIFTNLATTLLPIPKPSLIISWSEFFSHFDCFSSVGLSETGNVISFEEKQDLIDDINIIDLPEPAADTFKVSLDTGYNFNELDIGYNNNTSDLGTLNGNQEFNTTFIFKTPLLLHPAVLNKVSPIITGCYEIEKVRVSTVNLTTTEYNSDNKVYGLHIENTLRSGLIFNYYNIDRSMNAGATGIIEPTTVFNIGFSPKRMFKRNGPFIRSSLYLSDTQNLKYISSNINAGLISPDLNPDLTSQNIEEKADVNIATLGSKFFVPVIFDFGMNVPFDLFDLLAMNPLQILRFPFKGKTYKGIIINVTMGIANNNQKNFQLLSTADNDLSQLINYYGA